MHSELSNEDFNSISRQKLRLLRCFFSDSEPKLVSLASSVLSLYKASGIQSIPNIYIAHGPDRAAEMLLHARGRDCENLYLPNCTFGQHIAAVSVADQLFNYTNRISRESIQKMKGYFSDEALLELRNMVFADLNFQCGHAYANIIIDSLVQRYRQKGLLYDELPSLYPSSSDIDWVGYYSILREAIHLDISVPRFYENFILRGGLLLHAFDSFAVIVLRPAVILRNENLVVHNERGAAVCWPDGLSYYFWHGVQVPEKLIMSPQTVIYDDIISEENAEVRRCYQEVLGSEQFANILGIESIDIKTDKAGNELVLFRTRERDKFAGDHIYFAKVICPSTARAYFLCVPPQIKSVEEAVAWTFGKSAGEYSPIIET